MRVHHGSFLISGDGSLLIPASLQFLFLLLDFVDFEFNFSLGLVVRVRQVDADCVFLAQVLNGEVPGLSVAGDCFMVLKCRNQ